MTQATDRDAEQPMPPSLSRVNRAGPWFAAIWLFFLVDALLAGWDRRDELSGLLGMAATVAFAATYLMLWIRARADRARLIGNPPLRVGLGYIAAEIVLATLMVGFLGEPGMSSAVYVAIGFVMLFPVRFAAAGVVTTMAVVLLVGSLSDWDSQVGTVFGVLAASMAIFGLRTVLARNLELVAAHQRNAHLAVENERTRFARDLHDILGHSLTVITVKAELAQRLMDVDVERARAEVADLERLSRDALADVRRAVEGYRELTLPGEIARARIALAAAEIDADLPNTTDEVPSDLRELFAWTVREGVTNVIRHSGAAHCRVLLTASSAEVCDDGAGSGAPAGSGLTGLDERAGAVGAVLVTRDLTPGFSVKVVRA